MKLGLLGTIIGFIMMLAPIAGSIPAIAAPIRSSMKLMSDGMAVAMYTTLAGLVGSILVRIQYYMLDDATAKLFALRRRPDRSPCRFAPRESPGGGGMIDEFDLMPRKSRSIRSAVMLFKALQVLAFLFFIASPIAPEAKDGKDRQQGRIPRHHGLARPHPDDFDMFVQDPLGNVVWYRRREAGFMLLDRDDRGGANNFIMVNGEKILSPIRQETVSIRGIVAGEYTVNVYHFIAMGREPVPVSVKVEKLNPTVQVVYYDTIMLERAGTERTAVRFSIDGSGAVVDVNQSRKVAAADAAQIGAQRGPTNGTAEGNPGSVDRLCAAGGAAAGDRVARRAFPGRSSSPRFS